MYGLTHKFILLYIYVLRFIPSFEIVEMVTDLKF